MLVKRLRLKAEERENIEKECLTSSEVKLDILVSIVDEMMQKITMRDDFFIQDHHVSLITEEEEVVGLNFFFIIPTSID